ncbi:hypothetical protein [Kitasatospora cineracea]|uniref:hypothetical protein n=1 Tax=Kitasatospora cineracea TaxID=88074 RepID=UPI00367A61E7
MGESSGAQSFGQGISFAEIELIGPEMDLSAPSETVVFMWWCGWIDIAGRYSAKTKVAAEALAEALGACVLGDDD